MLKTRLYLIHMLGAIIIGITLGAHMIALHLNKIMSLFGFKDVKPTSWESMIGRADNVTWVIIYIVLLAFALYHALYGLRGIILETTTSMKTESTINWIFIIIGIAVFIWGAYVPIALLSR